MKFILCLLAASLACVSCSTKYTEQELIGLWIEPIPGMPGKVQGIALEQGGTAHSINMATLAYESWQCSGDELVLTGESIGNGTKGRFTDMLKIETVSADSLILMRGNLRVGYRRSVEDCGFTAASGEIMRGIVTFAPEVRIFRPYGDTTVFWLIDRSGYLNEKYRQSGVVEWNADAELELRVVDRTAAEFAADYDAAYEVMRIIRLSERDDR